MAIEPDEIERFRRNLNCEGEACAWFEAPDGSARCRTCGSGFGPDARDYLAGRLTPGELAARRGD